jgi:type II secretion system protein N
MHAPPGDANSLPKSIRYLGIPLVGIALTLVFVHLGFAYEPLVARAARALEQSQGLTIHYGEVSGRLLLLGPGIEVEDVQVSRPGEPDIEIERLRLRPAWSMSWLQGRPSVHADARLAVGRVNGAIALAEPRGFDGWVEELDLSLLPTARYAAGLKLRGSLDADISVSFDPEGVAIGHAELAAAEGSLGLPGTAAIPYDSFDAELSLGREEGRFLTIESAEFTGPMISASASGHVARNRGGPANMDIEIQLAVVDKGVVPVLRGMGVQLDDSGHATERLGGTLARPVRR